MGDENRANECCHFILGQIVLLFFLLLLCVWVCVCERACVQSWMSPQSLSTLCFWDRVSHSTWNSLAGYRAQGSSSETAIKHLQTWPFRRRPRGWVEPSLQLLNRSYSSMRTDHHPSHWRSYVNSDLSFMSKGAAMHTSPSPPAHPPHTR